tara:strand:+ start:1254 stop:2213 length:960 start_codon:yes stop_codon:yes gene_type:complete
MTWERLIQRALVPFEGRAGQLDKRAGLYMDEAQEDFAMHTKCFVKKCNIYIVEGKVYVDLPKDFIELADSPIFRGERLSRSSYGSMHFNKEITTNQVKQGPPAEYSIENQKFYFLPRPSTSGVLTITYVATPKSLRSLTGLQQIRFDNVVSEFFDAGQVIKSRPGSAGSTSTVATIEKVEYDKSLGGLLTLSNLTNGFTVDNENFFVSAASTTYYENSYSGVWSSFITTWNQLGFGGMAQVVGVQYSKAETAPSIPEAYHYHLVDYVKAMIHQDLGNIKAFQNHFALYIANKEKARTTVANADKGGMSYVVDALSENAI